LGGLDFVRESSINSSTGPRRFRFGRGEKARLPVGQRALSASRHAKMMDEIDLRRKRRSELAASDLA
jgi:hypothetical protein